MFILISMMVLGNVERVSASEPLYDYERWTTKWTEKKINTTKTLLYRSYKNINDIQNYPQYTSYSRLLETNSEVFTGDPATSRWNTATNHSDRYYLDDAQVNLVAWKLLDIRRYIDSYDSWSGTNYENIEFNAEKYTKERGKGNYRDTITGTINQYPQNGISGDYWYVRKGLANTNPTLTINSPVENSYFV